MAPEIWTRLLKSGSPSEFYGGLTDGEKATIENWRGKRSIVLRDRVQKEIEAELECVESLIRESIPFLRVLVQSAALTFSNEGKREQALLTIWSPTEEQVCVLQEGSLVQIQNLAVRETEFDGLVQLTANSRTYIEACVRASRISPHVCLGYTKRYFQNLFQVHVLSHQAAATKVGKSLGRTDDVDLVACLLRVEKDAFSNAVTLHVTDESQLILRVHCEYLPPSIAAPSSSLCAEAQNLACDHYRVVAFCDLRVLPYDGISNCAVARFCNTSSLSKSAPTKRIQDLRRWTSTTIGRQSLDQTTKYLHAQLTMWPSYDPLTAFGYVMGVKVESLISSSGELLYLEVDCGNSDFEEWEFPIHLLQDMLSASSMGKILKSHGGSCFVALNSAAESDVAKMKTLEKLFRSSGILWRFELYRRPGDTDRFVVRKVDVANVDALTKIHLQ